MQLHRFIDHYDDNLATNSMMTNRCVKILSNLVEMFAHCVFLLHSLICDNFVTQFCLRFLLKPFFDSLD